MKKVLIALLCFCFVIPCFAFPASAAETVTPRASTYILYGTYHMKDTLTLPSNGFGNSGSFSSMTYRPYFGDGSLINIIYFGSFFSDFSDLYFSYSGPDTNGNVSFYSADSGWADDAYKTITFPVPTVVSSDFYNRFSANYFTRNFPRECDGTLHPITDVNCDGTCELCDTWIVEELRPTPPPCDGTEHSPYDLNRDGICDTCGMTFDSSVTPIYECDGSLHTPVDANNDYHCDTCTAPIIPFLRNGYYNYRGHWLLEFDNFTYNNSSYDHAYLIRQNDTYYMGLFAEALYVNSSQNSIRFGGDGGFVLFQFDVTNVTWLLSGSFSSTLGNTYLSNAYSVLWSKYDLLTSGGTVWIVGDSNFVVEEPETPDPGGSGGGSSWDENTSNTLWGWLQSLWTGLGSIWDAITSLPSKIADLLLDGLKSLFVPDMNEMQEQFERLASNLNISVYPGPGGGANSGGGGRWESSVNGAFGEFGSIEGVPPGDISSDVTFGNLTLQNIKFADFSFLADGVSYFRPVINGFITFLLALFWYREFMSFIGQTPSMRGHSVSKEDSNDS